MWLYSYRLEIESRYSCNLQSGQGPPHKFKYDRIQTHRRHSADSDAVCIKVRLSAHARPISRLSHYMYAMRSCADRAQSYTRRSCGHAWRLPGAPAHTLYRRAAFRTACHCPNGRDGCRSTRKPHRQRWPGAPRTSRGSALTLRFGRGGTHCRLAAACTTAAAATAATERACRPRHKVAATAGSIERCLSSDLLVV